MKALITICILVAVIYGANELITYWNQKRQEAEGIKIEQAAKPVGVRGEDLPGLPPTFEASLAEAQNKGVAAFRNWLNLYRSYAKDPRLAWIELDYAVAVSREDPKEAKAVFQSVKARIGPSSPVYERVKKLEKTYE